MKQNKQQSIKSRLLSSKKRLVVGGIVAVAVVGQLAFDGYILARVLVQPPDTRIADMIIDSVDRLSKPGVIDPVRKQVYIPEANIVLPFYPSGVSGIRYGYSAIPDSSGASLMITSSDAIADSVSQVRNANAGQYGMRPFGNDEKTLEKIFDKVPELQACSRGYEILFGNGTHDDLADRELVEKRALADGRAMTVYRDKGCTFQPAGMTDYIKQIRSY